MNQAPSEHDELLNQDQAARLLNISPSTLATWRCTKRYNLPYVKIGRSCRYWRSQLIEFANRGRQEVQA